MCYGHVVTRAPNTYSMQCTTAPQLSLLGQQCTVFWRDVRLLPYGDSDRTRDTVNRHMLSFMTKKMQTGVLVPPSRGLAEEPEKYTRLEEEGGHYSRIVGKVHVRSTRPSARNSLPGPWLPPGVALLEIRCPVAPVAHLICRPSAQCIVCMLARTGKCQEKSRHVKKLKAFVALHALEALRPNQLQAMRPSAATTF
jgi:hypothetical protein